MQRIFNLIFFILIFSDLRSQVALKTWEIDNLGDFRLNRESLNINGKVKSIVCQNYVAEKNYNTSLNENWTDYTFDITGNLKEEIEWLGNSKFHSRIKYQFNKLGWVRSFTCYENDSSILYIHEHSYPDKDYNTATEKDANGKEKAKRTFRFDKNDNLIETKYIMPYRKSDSIVYKYDGQNRIILKENFTSGNKKYETQSTYKYDPASIIEIKRFSEKELYSIVTKTFSSGGVLMKESWLYPNREKEYESESIYEYDIHKNITSYTKIVGGEKKTSSCYTSKYECDIMGNWIKRIMYNDDGSLNSTIERRIKYFAD